MSARGRLAVFLLGALGLAAIFVVGYIGIPHFGSSDHPYRDRAVHASLVGRHTSNTVASVSFDQRGIDTLIEESILFTSVVGAVVLLRPNDEEEEESDDDGVERAPGGQRIPEVLDGVRLFGYILLPVTVLVGMYVVAHGHLTPGGGFQGGVVLATALHLLYLAGDYPALDALRPKHSFEAVESIGAGGYAILGLLTLLVSGDFLFNVLPYGSLGSLTSAGIVPVLNAAVGLAVGAGLVLLLREFFEQVLVVRGD